MAWQGLPALIPIKSSARIMTDDHDDLAEEGIRGSWLLMGQAEDIAAAPWLLSLFPFGMVLTGWLACTHTS